MGTVCGVTGRNYSKRLGQFPRGGALTAGVSPVIIVPVQALDPNRRRETDATVNERRATHGAIRIERHPLLEPLPERPVVTFTFDGHPIEAREGEPITAALLAAGWRVLRTMPRSGETRGGYCMVDRCPDCAVVVDGVPNVRSCLTPVRDGLEVRTQYGLGDQEPSP